MKVLDFGLAKVSEASSSGSHQAETITSPAYQRHSPTMPGVILGTAAYMSPEQARGCSIDKRTDVWSFGVVLYECLTGANPFLGETVTDSIGAILHKDVDLTLLPRTTPPGMRQLLRRSLQRDKLRRLQAIGDARIEMEESLEQVESGEIDHSHHAVSRKFAWVWASLAVLLAIALGVSMLRNSPDEVHRVLHREPEPVVTELVQLTNLPGMESHPSISPDGRMLLFVARVGQKLDIFLQRISGENAINLALDSSAVNYDPVFSPDGQRIAFRSEREGGGLFVMGATGESPRRVSEDGYDPAWSPDGMDLVFTTENVQGPYS